MHFKMIKLTDSRIIVISAIFLTAFYNQVFFYKLIEIQPLSIQNSLYIGTFAIILCSVTILIFLLACYRYTTKPVLISIFLVSASASYFMDAYNTVIDDTMIENILSTDLAESLDLVSLKLLVYILLLGIFPSILIYKSEIIYLGFKKEILSRIKILFIAVLSILIIYFTLGDFYTAFFREHKITQYANPSYYIYSAGKYIKARLKTTNLEVRSIGQDAKIPSSDIHRELIILVVGETARADRFSLNGYARETNPLLAKESVINFPDFWSCGTSTAVSVPCMFSIYNRSDFDIDKADSTENFLDVITRSGANVIWMDNNSGSKGVADRVPFVSYKTSENNPICDIECRDEGMLSKLQQYIEEHTQGDIFIVLHQMGNHGPTYYKRYPSQFERFTPTCKTNQLETCSKEQIDNTYDNIILYTDYFLSKVIHLLEHNDAEFETAMLYVSDHGESLGEAGLYLHGFPYLLAPDAQKHVPAIMWFGESFDEINTDLLRQKANDRYTHDNLFHTVLGMLEIETSIYQPEYDILQGTKQEEEMHPVISK